MTRDCGRPEDGMCVEACEPGMCWAGPLGEACDYAYCVRCGYMFIKTPPLPAISCRCGAMQERP